MRRSPRCQQAIDYARKAYQRLGQAQLCSSHLILGLLTLNGGVADTLLKRAGLSVESVEEYLLSLPHKRGAQPARPVGGSAAKALKRAEATAKRRSFRIYGVEDLLLALLAEKKGPAARVFRSTRVNRGKMRQTILRQVR
jgi:ATP-dependent Clp protease ATP-binding subunit ClpC